MPTDDFHGQHAPGGKEWGGFLEVVSPRPQVALGVTAS